MTTPRNNNIRVWLMVAETPKALFLLPKLLHEFPDQASCDAWLKRAYPRKQPGNMLVGNYDLSEAVEHWNTHR